jgi:hypothetical protein
MPLASCRADYFRLAFLCATERVMVSSCPTEVKLDSYGEGLDHIERYYLALSEQW